MCDDARRAGPARGPDLAAQPRFGIGTLTVARVQRAEPFSLARELAALSISEIEALDDDGAQAVIAAAERVVTAAHARSAVALATLANRVQGRLDADAEDFRAHTGKGTTYQSAGD